MVLSCFNTVFAEDEEFDPVGSDQTNIEFSIDPKEDPNNILTDPNFDLSSVPNYVLNAWYETEVNFQDENLEKEMMRYLNVEKVTIGDIIGMNGSLDLKNLGITSLQGLEYAINLKSLDISGNDLINIDSLKSLYSLEFLDYSHNKVKVIQSWLFNIRNIKIINGSYNESAVFLEPDCEICSLEELYLDGNQLSSIPDISNLTSLTVLSLNNNAFTKFPNSILELKKLNILSLSGNSIYYIDDISTLTNLKVLLLDNNKLSEFPGGLESLYDLAELYIQSNFINSIPDSLIGNKNLKVFIVYNNNIEHLPEILSSMDNLEYLDVNLNGINISESKSIIKTLNDSLITFLYELQKPCFDLSIAYERNSKNVVIKWGDIEGIEISGQGYYVIDKICVYRMQTSRDSASGLDESKPALEIYELIDELEPNAVSYKDDSVNEYFDYFYKITVKVSGEYTKYEECLKFSTEGSEYTSTRMISRKKSYLTYIITVLGLLAIVIVFILRIRKKSVLRFNDKIDEDTDNIIEKNKYRYESIMQETGEFPSDARTLNTHNLIDDDKGIKIDRKNRKL